MSQLNPEKAAQSTTTIPESYLEFATRKKGGFELDADYTTPWVGAAITMEVNAGLGLSDEYMQTMSDRVYSEKVLLAQAERAFSRPNAKRAFNQLLSEFVGQDDAYLDRIREMGIPLIEPGSPTNFIYDESATYDYASYFSNPYTPNEDRITLVEAHAAALHQAQEKLDQQIPEITARYARLLEYAVSQGMLPESALPDADKARLIGKIRYVASDPVANALVERKGEYAALENTVLVDGRSVFDKLEVEHVIFHELTHAYSGKTYAVSLKKHRTGSHDEIADEGLDVIQLINRDPSILAHMDISPRRVGLATAGEKDVFIDTNEAVTEYIALSLTGNHYEHEDLWNAFQDYVYSTESLPETNPKRFGLEVTKKLQDQFGRMYLAERILLAGLVTLGVGEKLFFDAYFESYEHFAGERNGHKAARFVLDKAIEGATGFSSLRRFSKHLKVETKEEAKKGSNDWLELLTFDEEFFEDEDVLV